MNDTINENSLIQTGFRFIQKQNLLTIVTHDLDS